VLHCNWASISSRFHDIRPTAHAHERTYERTNRHDASQYLLADLVNLKMITMLNKSIDKQTCFTVVAAACIAVAVSTKMVQLPATAAIEYVTAC